jgi:hypothetical protein
LSISSLVGRFGIDLYVYRPTLTTASDGTVVRTFSSAAITARGFVQPTGQTQDVFEGRASSRTTGTAYFDGALDIRIEDEIYSGTSGSVTAWRVTGAVNPGEMGRTLAALHLNMTAVDVVEVEPTVAL